MKPPSYHRHTSQGKALLSFGLIELLVAVTMIVILVSLLLPVGSKMLVSGRRTATLMQMKNIGTSMFLYANDNNNSLPGPTTVAICIWGKNPLTTADSAHLGNWLAPYYGVPPDQRQYTIAALQCRLQPIAAQKNLSTANYVIPLDTDIQSVMGFPMGSIGAAQDAIAAGKGPKKLIALTTDDKNIGIVTTADKSNWLSANNVLLPDTTADSKGRRLWLFLDGTVELSTGKR